MILATLITAGTIAANAEETTPSPENALSGDALLVGEPTETLPPDLAPLHFEGEALGTPKLTSDPSQETFASELDDGDAGTVWCPNPSFEGEPSARFFNLEGDGPPALYSISGIAIGSPQADSPYFSRARVVLGDRVVELGLQSSARWHVFRFSAPVSASFAELTFLEPSTGALEGTCVADVTFFGLGSSATGTADTALPNDGSAAAGIQALGYEIISGPGMGELRILLHGEEVWSIETYMVSHELRVPDGTGLFEVLVDTRENRQSGTQYLLELGPDSLRVLGETEGPPSGIQAPRGPGPSLDDLN